MRNELIVENDPKSPISEIFRTLRTNIQFMSSKDKNKTVLITSTSQGEGKSWITANLAVVFANSGKKVLLIDSDMRLARQYKIFGISPIPGISNLLSGLIEDEKEVIQTIDGIENLSIIPAGDIPPNPSELLTSDEFNKILKKLKKSYDVIIVDGPPVSLVTDGLLISRIVDNTIVVVENKRVKKEQLKNVINSIKNVGGKIAGVVLNKTENYSKQYKNSYYYGHGTKLENTDNEVKETNIIEEIYEEKNNNVIPEVKEESNNETETKTLIMKNIKEDIEEKEDVENKAVYTEEQVKQMQMQMRAAYQRQYQMYINNLRSAQMRNQNMHQMQHINVIQAQNVKPKVKFEEDK